MNDTITSISTALGVGAISIIRVSGAKAINIVNSIFKGKDLTKVKSHTINYGFIINNDEIIDEVLVSIMRSPKTYTTEDIVEINCHGGIATTNKILELVIEKGARLSDPGEFTKRAFLNGRIDLLKAEGIMDLIEAKTDKARKLSINQLSGKTTRVISDLRNNIVSILSNIAVNLDYPEYEDIEVVTNTKLLESLEQFKIKLIDIIKKSEEGKIIKEGINVSIIGKPNVGKSSLLNLLLEEDKAIVTDIPGTTRDIVEGRIIINGIILNLTDTAGIRQTDNIVEQIGVTKSLNTIDNSDLIILVLNNNEVLTKEEEDLLNKIKDKKHIILINKIDLESKLELDNDNIIKISVKEDIGITELKNKIIELFNLDKLETTDINYLSNSRSIALLKQSLSKLEEVIEYSMDNTPIDIIELDIRNIWNILGEIIGESYKEELLDELFARFCLGK